VNLRADHEQRMVLLPRFANSQTLNLGPILGTHSDFSDSFINTGCPVAQNSPSRQLGTHGT